MSSIEGNFNRASRKYLTKIGYLTESRPQLFLNGKQLQGIASQQRSNRKFEGFNEAADREYDAAVREYDATVLNYKKSQVDFYMPAAPKSKPGVSKRGGRRKKTKRKRKRTKKKTLKKRK